MHNTSNWISFVKHNFLWYVLLIICIFTKSDIIGNLWYQNFKLEKTYLRIPKGYLTIIPRARMGSESIAHEAEGRMGYWLRGHEGERNNFFSKIQLVGQKLRE